MPYEDLARLTRRSGALTDANSQLGGWFMEQEYVYPQIAAAAVRMIGQGVRKRMAGSTMATLSTKSGRRGASLCHRQEC